MSQFDSRIGLKDPERSIISNKSKGVQVFFLMLNGYERGTLICDNSLSYLNKMNLIFEVWEAVTFTGLKTMVKMMSKKLIL